MVVKEKEFIRTFILELILVKKESVFDLWDDEIVYLPNNFLNILDDIMEDDIKKLKYGLLIPNANRDSWKWNVYRELHNFLNDPNVQHSYQDDNMIINLNRNAILEIINDKNVSSVSSRYIACLAEEFIMTKSKTKPKEKTLK